LFRNQDSDRISSDGRIRPDQIGPGIGFIDLGKRFIKEAEEDDQDDNEIEDEDEKESK